MTFATSVMTKINTPNGGVSVPISKLITITIPKWTGSIPNVFNAGTKTGTATRSIAVVSITIPKINSAILTSKRITNGLSLIESNTSASCCGIPSKAKIALNGVAAAIIKTSAPQVIIVSFVDFQK